MNRTLLAAVTLACIIVSCQQAPVEYVHRVDTLYIRDTLHVPDTNALRLKGTLHGNARLYDFGGYALDNSGITVQFEKTGYSTITEASGNWSMKGLPTGTYNITFSKEGYDSYRVYGFQFVGGGDVYGPNQPLLPLLPTVSILDFKVSNIDRSNVDNLMYSLGGRLSSATKGIGVRIFLGHDSTVSSDPLTYSFTFTMIIDALTGEFDQRAYFATSSLTSYGFKRGDRVYMVAYPVAGPSIFRYWNPEIEQNVEIGLGPRSNVFSFIVN
jgi:hypothetical protein